MDTATIFIIWAFIAFIVGIVGIVGKDRKIGLVNSFLLAFFLTPIIALIIVLNSKTESQIKNEENKDQMINKLQESVSDKEIVMHNSISIELEKLAELKSKGVINEEEFEIIKTKIINS